MDFNDIKTDELIEIYKKIDEFIKFLEKENQETKDISYYPNVKERIKKIL